MQVNGPKVARLVRKEWFLAAWIGCFHFPDVGRRLTSTVLIDKEQTWLAVFPSLVRNLVQDLACIELSCDLIVPRIDEVILRPCFDGLQKLVCDGD